MGNGERQGYGNGNDMTHRGDPTPLLGPSPRLRARRRSYEGQAAERAEKAKIAENGIGKCRLTARPTTRAGLKQVSTRDG